MGKNKNTFTFTQANIIDLLASYYRGYNKEVQAEFSRDEKGYTSIKINEYVLNNGIKELVTSELKPNDFEKIMCRIYKMAGRRVKSVVNYGEAGTSVMDCGNEVLVRPEQENMVVVETQEIPKVNVKK